MKKVLKIICVIIIVIVLFAAAVIALNWEKVVVVKNAVTNTYTEEDMEELEKKNYEVLNRAAESVLNVTLIPLTEEEKQALREGKITEEEAREIVLGQKVYVNEKVIDAEEVSVADQNPKTPLIGAIEIYPDGASDKGNVNGKPKGDDNTEKGNLTGTRAENKTDKSAEIISEIYVLESVYKSKLKNIERSVLKQYNDLPEAEKTSLNKYKLANSAMAQGIALKEECDAKLENLLTRLKTALKQSGKDTSIVGEIRKVYEDEKTTVQSYYMSKYAGR